MPSLRDFLPSAPDTSVLPDGGLASPNDKSEPKKADPGKCSNCGADMPTDMDSKDKDSGSFGSKFNQGFSNIK